MKTRFAIVLEAQADTVDPNTRLKRLLKFALRVCGLRCVECRETEPAKPPP